jgi:succinate dehydrogenase / fumarate reductase cytochrome b subunit
MTAAVKKRPKHLDLTKIRMPLSAKLSILHRVSGAGLFLFFIPLLLGGLQASLGSQEGFDAMAAAFQSPFTKLIMIGFVWAYMHHFCAGIRYLLLDVHRGIDLASSHRSSQIVFGVSLLLTLIIAIKIW